MSSSLRLKPNSGTGSFLVQWLWGCSGCVPIEVVMKFIVGKKASVKLKSVGANRL